MISLPITCTSAGHISLNFSEGFGLNSNDRPVGGTVDGTSGNSNIICECSTERDYFRDKNFRKISNDIEHAIRYNPSNTSLQVFLISSQKEPTKCRQ